MAKFELAIFVDGTLVGQKCFPFHALREFYADGANDTVDLLVLPVTLQLVRVEHVGTLADEDWEARYSGLDRAAVVRALEAAATSSDP